MKIGRNQECTCGSGKKYKKCCGGVQYAQPEAAPVVAPTTTATGSLYQPIAAHGYGPAQFEEMMRFAQWDRPAR